jgi:hypothetical protein
MTTATEQTNHLFTEAVLSDHDRGYPDDVAFIAADLPEWPRMVWLSLVDDHPTVLVNDEALEIMFVPKARRAPLKWLDRARDEMWVQIVWRLGAHRYGLSAKLDQARLGDLELGGDVPGAPSEPVAAH